MSPPSPLLCVLVLLALPFLLEAQGTPAPAPAALPDPVGILKNRGKYNTLLQLLTEKKLVGAIGDQLKTSEGITIFAPTDSAFGKLPNGTYEKLPANVQTELLLLHVAPKFYTKETLSTASNRIRTLAPSYNLTVIRSNNQVNVSTGVVNVPVDVLYDKSPLAIFSIESVLIPPQLAGGNAPAPSPTAGGPSTPGAPPPASGSCRGRRTAWGVLLGAGVAFLALLQ